MGTINDADLKLEVNKSVRNWHQMGFDKLDNFDADEVLEVANALKLKAEGVVTGDQLVTNLMNGHFIASREGKFGHVTEYIALYVVKVLYDGHKSEIKGMDLQYLYQNILYFIQQKSSWVWGNEDQVKNFERNVSKAKALYPKARFYNLCSYGRHKPERMNGYLKMAGKDAWGLLTGDNKFYYKLVDLIEVDSKYSLEYQAKYDKVAQSFLRIIKKRGLLNSDGTINWYALM